VSQNSQRVYQQIRLLDPLSSTDIITDVLIIDNKIEAIESKISSISEKIEVIDGEGLILAPGLVDLYSHSAEPGYEERETFVSLTEAAMAGGFTRIAILPNTVPVIDNPATLALLQSKINSPKLQFYFWGSLTQNLEGKKISELADLVNSGVIGFTDNKSHGNLNLIRRLLEYAQPFNLPIGLIPCDLQLRGNGVVREGDMSIKLGLLGDPTLSETVAIASIIELVAETKTPVHLMRISTARGVELIKQAKERDLPITASCTWMHLLFNTEAIASYDSNYRLEPPLGSENDRLALIEGIKEGVIDAIAIDHTAYTYE
jgi:dihydroorotase